MDMHVAKGTFDLPFPCFECDRLGNKPYTVFSASKWSNHTERVHGKLHAPVLVTSLSTEKPSTRSSKKRKRASKAEEEQQLPGMLVLDGLEEPERKKMRSSRSRTASPLHHPSPIDRDVTTSLLPGSPVCKLDGDDTLPESAVALYVDLSLAGLASVGPEPMKTYPLSGKLDDDQYSSCPDLLADSSSDTSDDTSSQDSFSLGYPFLDFSEQLADTDNFAVSPLSTLLVKPEPELRATKQDDDERLHQDWQLDFSDDDEGEMFC